MLMVTVVMNMTVTQCSVVVIIMGAVILLMVASHTATTMMVMLMEVVIVTIMVDVLAIRMTVMIMTCDDHFNRNGDAHSDCSDIMVIVIISVIDICGDDCGD
jgi:hypothetical protein